MTQQQTYDTVVAHLRAQKKKSYKENVGCSYRGDNGLKCAVGRLIPHQLYKPELEGKTAVSQDVSFLLTVLGHDPELCNSLQMAHDDMDNDFDMDVLERRIKLVAEDYNLTYTKPEV